MVGTRQGPDAPRSLPGLWEERPGGSGALELHFTRNKFKSSGAVEQGGPGPSRGHEGGARGERPLGRMRVLGGSPCAPLI